MKFDASNEISDNISVCMFICMYSMNCSLFCRQIDAVVVLVCSPVCKCSTQLIPNISYFYNTYSNWQDLRNYNCFINLYEKQLCQYLERKHVLNYDKLTKYYK